MTTVIASWVTGRRKALARALAVEAVRLQGLSWSSIGVGDRRRIMREADETIERWIEDDVLVEFVHEWTGADPRVER